MALFGVSARDTTASCTLGTNDIINPHPCCICTPLYLPPGRATWAGGSATIGEKKRKKRGLAPAPPSPATCGVDADVCDAQCNTARTGVHSVAGSIRARTAVLAAPMYALFRSLPHPRGTSPRQCTNQFPDVPRVLIHKQHLHTVLQLLATQQGALARWCGQRFFFCFAGVVLLSERRRFLINDGSRLCSEVGRGSSTPRRSWGLPLLQRVALPWAQRPELQQLRRAKAELHLLRSPLVLH